MTKFPRILATFLPLTLVLACGDDTPADDDGTGTETAGDGDGDPTGDGDGDPTGDGDGDPTGDGDGDPTGDGDGDPTGDGDGDPTGDGDGDPDPELTEIRVLHLGVDAPNVDVYVDGAVDPAVADLAFQSGTAYLELEAGVHSVVVTAAGDATPVLTLDDLDLAVGTMYSAVAYDYLENISALLLTDDASGLDAGNTRAQVSHTAPDVGQVDIWLLGDAPSELIADLDFGATSSIDYAAGPISIGIDLDNDENPELTFDLPDLGGGTFVDLYAVNEAEEGPAFLLAHLPDGSTARINPTVCGDGEKQLSEVCDGADAGDQTCADFGFDGGTLGCSETCDEVVITGCYMEYTQCYGGDPVAITEPGPAQGQPVQITVADVPGTIVDVRVSVDITHTRVNDLEVRLVKGNNVGTATTLFSGILANGTEDACTGADIVATLDDSALQSVDTQACDIDATPAVSGTFAPTDLLDNYDTTGMNATWNLRVRDTIENTEVGTVNDWCITFGYTN
jgi:hypothetical protein